MTISPDILARSWGQKSDAMKYVRKNQIDLTGHEVARTAEGRYAIRPVEPEDENVPLSPSQIEVATDGSVTVGSGVASEEDAAQAAAEADAVAEADAEAMTEPGEEAEAQPEAEPEDTGPNLPMTAKVILQIEEPYPGDVALMWAHNFAKRVKEKIFVRDADTFEVLRIIDPRAKRQKAARPAGAQRPRQPRSGDGPIQRIIACLKREDGATLKEIAEASGWNRPPAKSYLTALGKRHKYTLEVVSGEGAEARYRGKFDDAAPDASVQEAA